MTIEVLWIDDQCKEALGIDFIGNAEQDDINITAYESHEEGIADLEKNPNKYDAVLLDAKVKEKKEDTKLGKRGLRASLDYLIAFNANNYLPYFIFTGNPDYQTSEDFREDYGDFYIKGQDEDQLLEDITDRVQNREEYILKKKYTKVFEACTEKYHLQDASPRMLEIIKTIEGEETGSSTKELFTPVRKVVEMLFDALYTFQLMPEEVSSSLNRAANFLAGKSHEYDIVTPVFSPVLCRTFWPTLQVIQDASHYKDDLTIKVDQYIQEQNTSFLYKSVVFQILDLLVWFKRYIDSKPEPNNWIVVDQKNDDKDQEEQNWILGEVFNKHREQGYAFFKEIDQQNNNGVYIRKSLVEKHMLDDGNKVRCTIIEYPDKNDPTQRKTRVKEIERLSLKTGG